MDQKRRDIDYVDCVDSAEEKKPKQSAEWKEKPKNRAVKINRARLENQSGKPPERQTVKHVDRRPVQKKAEPKKSGGLWFAAAAGVLVVLAGLFWSGKSKKNETAVDVSAVQAVSSVSVSAPEETGQTVSSVLQVAPIAQAEQDVPVKEEYTYEAGSVEFLEYSGSIASDEQKDLYYFTAPETGKYHCEMDDMMSGFTTTMCLYDSLENEVDYYNGAGNGDGMTTSLQAGQTYALQIKSWSGTGDYTVKIGQAKNPADISSDTVVHDAIEFEGQQVYYNYTPAEDGKYRFEIAQINQGVLVSISIYDDAGYEVDYNNGIGQGDGVTTTLNAGRTYRVIVKQYSNLGAYTMNIGAQKPTIDISGVTVLRDGITYRGQKNNYMFTAAEDGVYRFEIDRINSGVSVSMELLDEAGYTVEQNTYMGKNDGLCAELQKDKTYRLIVSQCSDCGDYTMTIGTQKKMEDISAYSQVEDSIQFNGQVNLYGYRPASNGSCVFELAEMVSELQVSVEVYDDENYCLSRNSWMHSGDRVSVELEAGREYRIKVLYCSGYGNYTLKTEV